VKYLGLLFKLSAVADMLCVFIVHDRLTSAGGQLAMNREKAETQRSQISDYEKEIQLLAKQQEGLENEREKDRKKIGELREALTRARKVRIVASVYSYFAH